MGMVFSFVRGSVRRRTTGCSLVRSIVFFARVLFLLSVFFFVQATQAAQAESLRAPFSSRLEIYRLDQRIGLAPAGSFLGVFWLTPASGWYTYAHDPGPTGRPTTLQALLAPDKKFFQVLYPPGVVKEDSLNPGMMVEAFVEPTPIFLIFPAGLKPDDVLHLHLQMLLCSERSCWPVDHREAFSYHELQEVMNEADHDEILGMKWVEQFVAASPGKTHNLLATQPDALATGQPPASLGTERLEPVPFQPDLEVHSLGKAMILALLGGLILNLTPCVLPVVSLKLRGLIPDVGAGGMERQRKAFRDHNQLFALGILTFFMFLALLLSLTGMVWGELFQNPTTVIVLATMLLALSLSLFGVFNLPVIDLKFKVQGRSSLAGTSAGGQAYCTGMLATLLATPCSGPFLGGVLAWTLMQPPLVVAGVFFCVGLGMALPYFIVSLFPTLVRFLPRPGNWTLYLEKILGFLLLATCIYLLTFLPEEFLFPVLVLFWVTGMAAWVWGGWTNLSQTVLRRWSIRALALVLVLSAGSWALTTKPVTSHWEAFSGRLFTEALGQDRMLLEFTAQWCPNCKFLEKTVLTPDNLKPLQEKYDLRLIKVDLTHENPSGMELLRGLGSNSIPLVAIFERGDAAFRPLILRDMFTLGQLEQALAKAFQENE